MGGRRGSEGGGDHLSRPELAAEDVRQGKWTNTLFTHKTLTRFYFEIRQEFKLVIPNSQRINRGNYQLKQLVESCRANAVTDFVVLHETRGEPDGLVICHLPFGPTAYFQLLNTVMRHDIPEVGTMSEAYPHLVLHNLTSNLGTRVGNILKYLFPVPKADSKRVITFANQNDYISFRHHVYKQVEGKVEIAEVGPRFELRLYQIKLGTLEMENAIDTEWAFKPYMNTTKKRQFLSDGTANDDDDVSGGKKENAGKEESRTNGKPSFK